MKDLVTSISGIYLVSCLCKVEGNGTCLQVSIKVGEEAMQKGDQLGSARKVPGRVAKVVGI